MLKKTTNFYNPFQHFTLKLGILFQFATLDINVGEVKKPGNSVVIKVFASKPVDLRFIFLIELCQNNMNNDIHSFPAWRSGRMEYYYWLCDRQPDCRQRSLRFYITEGLRHTPAACCSNCVVERTIDDFFKNYKGLSLLFKY